MIAQTIDLHEIYRPIQYLGSKLRSLPRIGEAIFSLKHQPSTALDLFSGSTVVAQYLKRLGLQTVGNDAMSFSTKIADATLSDFKTKKTESELNALILNGFKESDILDYFQVFYYREKNAIKNKDGVNLIDLYKKIPQIWWEDKENFFKDLSLDHKQNNTFSLLYAGTYFGLNQTVEIDYIRNKIKQLRDAQEINNFEESLLLTAMLSAISKAVFSAGKHFAQPHLIRDSKSTDFIQKRIVEDRSVNILSYFSKSLNDILNIRKKDASNGSKALNKSLEELLNNNFNQKFDVIYVDPPYTAQQYSRFYHIPEIAVNYDFPKLQRVKGKITSGIYPEDKFKSRFCSKHQAPSAFKDVFKLAKMCESSLIISYSLSKTSETGNARMISIDKILSLAKEYFGNNVKLIEFDHTYRQFNKKANMNNGKEDKEIQIVCERD
ncbi:DNA adenine methylase [Legionella pneumophila serogroup 1]